HAPPPTTPTLLKVTCVRLRARRPCAAEYTASGLRDGPLLQGVRPGGRHVLCRRDAALGSCGGSAAQLRSRTGRELSDVDLVAELMGSGFVRGSAYVLGAHCRRAVGRARLVAVAGFMLLAGCTGSNKAQTANLFDGFLN